MVSPLLFVPPIFLTITGLSSFYSLNLCFATIFLSINIPITLLSKSTFTIIPSYVFIFSTPIFNYTSLGILNIFLISLCLSSSFTVPFGTSVYVPLYCASPCLGYTAIFQFHYSCFFLIYHKWPFTELWVDNLIIKRLKKAKFRQ